MTLSVHLRGYRWKTTALSVMTVCAALLLLSACTRQPEWSLFFYSDREVAAPELRIQDIAGYYDSLAQCQAKGRGMRQLSMANNAGFICAQQCQVDPKDNIVCSAEFTE